MDLPSDTINLNQTRQPLQNSTGQLLGFSGPNYKADQEQHPHGQQEQPAALVRSCDTVTNIFSCPITGETMTWTWQPTLDSPSPLLGYTMNTGHQEQQPFVEQETDVSSTMDPFVAPYSQQVAGTEHSVVPPTPFHEYAEELGGYYGLPEGPPHPVEVVFYIPILIIL